MQPALLCALLVLLSQGDACVGPEDELCRDWTYGMDSRVGAFQCPQRRYGADAKFCCGTCSLPYCCSSGEACLDQQQCPRVGRLQASTSTSGPLPQASTTKGPTSGLTPKKTHDFVAARWALIIIFVIGVLFAIVGYCEERVWRLLRSLRFWNRGQEGIELLDFPPPPPAPFSGPLPPSSEDLPPRYSAVVPGPNDGEPPPPYHTEDPGPYSVEEPAENQNLRPPSPVVHFRLASAENREDEVNVRLLAQRNVPSHVSDPPSEMESSVGN